jgi:phosphoenolpyruvate carboxykinase (GTP)
MDAENKMKMGPTNHWRLRAWVNDMIELCQPARVYWCDGSQQEYDELCELMVQKGMLIRLNPVRRPGCFLARTHPSDVARLEERTFICSATPDEAGPTNNWAEPQAMRKRLRELFAGCMAGRTMYVVPFAMGPLDSPLMKIGVEITDSPYVVVHMRLTTRMGCQALERLGSGRPFIPCMHSVGMPLRPHQPDAPWPCEPNLKNKYIVHFPDDLSIWSYGSGYGGNALLGKKCLALRIASVLARREGWLAEHMLVLSITSPKGDTHYVTAAFPSACGKTNLAMMQATLPGWTVRCLGDDIAWIRLGEDGRMYAVNPEAGFFAVAPGASYTSNVNAMKTMSRNTIFTNVLLTSDLDVWWEGMDGAPPVYGIDWQGQPWTPDCGRKGAHPNARFTTSAWQCPVLDQNWERGEGVPISAILFGGRRARTVPLVTEAYGWEEGVLMGAAAASETTAAALHQTGVLRRDPFAMLPFCGYHMGDYLAHWLSFAQRTNRNKLPKIFSVNWFRQDDHGNYLWPGYGENSRVLKWICERVRGKGEAVETPIGRVPSDRALDARGLALNGELKELLRVNVTEWKQECDEIAAYFHKFGPKLPRTVREQLEALRCRLNNSRADAKLELEHAAK